MKLLALYFRSEIAVGFIAAVLGLTLFCSSAIADVEERTREYVTDASVEYLAELSKRRRLTTIFPNRQSAFNGVQIGYTNVTSGNLTFLNRDISTP